MKLSQIQQLINASPLNHINKDPDVMSCMGSDMMSDVLAFAKPGALLITGLTNAQSVRTADISDAAAVLYVRGKKPDEGTIDLADEIGVLLLSTDLGMFDVCGILHEKGLNGVC